MVFLFAMLACTDLTKAYGDTLALSKISCVIEPGACVCIIGAGGSGKSVLHRLLLGMEQPTSGSITVDNIDVKALPPDALRLYRLRVGAIGQEPHLFSHLTIAENIQYPLELSGMNAVNAEKTVKAMLQVLQLNAVADALPEACSRSQQMMTAIGRALIAEPMIVLADEPLALLDDAQRAIVITLLKQAHERGASLVVFSQDAHSAKTLHARIMKLENGVMSGDTTSAAATHPRRKTRVHEIKSEEAQITEKIEPEQPAEHAEPAAKEKRKIKITSVGF